MLQSRNLDDQPFEEIVRAAVGRLPWLCQEWTDHNEHDPGITVIELFAWYKEMQQYHMNRFTDDMKRKLLKLVGVTRDPAFPAVCYIEPSDAEAEYPASSRLETREEIGFELLDEISSSDPTIAACLIRAGERNTDVSDLVENAGIVIQPFRFGGERTEFFVGFTCKPVGRLRIWFETEPEYLCPRNPYTAPEQAPRAIRWSFFGGKEAVPVYDETHALSRSGYLEFSADGEWPEAELEGINAWWLRAELTDPGCQEEVRLVSLSSRKYRAVQRETWSRLESYTAECAENFCVRFRDALGRIASFAVFVRNPGGWRQETAFKEFLEEGNRVVRLDMTGAASDGKPNLMVVCSDPIHYRDLFFDSDGLPGLTVHLSLGIRQVLTDRLSVLCDSLDSDGEVRPAVWRYTEDFYACGPRDRVFTYDPLHETLTFGDGKHGALVPRGKSAVFVCGLELSHCAGGNIPEGRNLRFEDGKGVYNTAASGGADAESTDSAGARFLRLLHSSGKCVSAEDYERIAATTPGLRVSAVKAIPGYDPESSLGKSDRPVVTVVVIPYSASERPKPDGKFLAAVQERLESRRPVCGIVRTIGPRYAAVGLSVQLKIRGRVTEEKVKDAVLGFLSVGGERGIGDPIEKNALITELQKVPGVLRVERLELRALGSDCYVTAAGDMTVPPNAVAYLGALELDMN